MQRMIVTTATGETVSYEVRGEFIYARQDDGCFVRMRAFCTLDGWKNAKERFIRSGCKVVEVE